MQLGAAQLGMNLEFSAAPFAWPPQWGTLNFGTTKCCLKAAQLSIKSSLQLVYGQCQGHCRGTCQKMDRDDGTETKFRN